ncbi:MAG: ATP-binding cassette domain-containing protein, partial [Lachnospiraceae bacterium]|nr:ATP-binding cassette domain-containing protein [Lachnospiraceae bacterium]
YNVDEITNADLIKAMVGREINDLFPKPDVKIGKEVLRIENYTRDGFYKDISFTVHAGEIVGMTGLVGAGRTEVIESVCGVTHQDSGKLYLDGKEVHIKQPSDAMKLGIVLLPEDRQKEGLIMSWGLGRNVTLPVIDKYAKAGLDDNQKEREISKELLEEVDTKAVQAYGLLDCDNSKNTGAVTATAYGTSAYAVGVYASNCQNYGTVTAISYGARGDGNGNASAIGVGDGCTNSYNGGKVEAISENETAWACGVS